MLQIEHGVAVNGGGINDRKIQLRFGRTQLVHQFKGVVDHPIRTRAIAINFIDHNDRPEAQSQGFFGHETRLRHRAFNRIHQQQDPINHRQHALDFTAEISVTRGIHDVDVDAFIINGGVLGENGNAALFFKIVGIHDAFSNVLVGGEGTGLMKKFVNKGSFTVVDVGDDGDISKGAWHGIRLRLSRTIETCSEQLSHATLG